MVRVKRRSEAGVLRRVPVYSPTGSLAESMTWAGGTSSPGFLFWADVVAGTARKMAPIRRKAPIWRKRMAHVLLGWSMGRRRSALRALDRDRPKKFRRPRRAGAGQPAGAPGRLEVVPPD